MKNMYIYKKLTSSLLVRDIYMDILELLPSQPDIKKIKWEYTDDLESYKNHTQYIDIIVVHAEDIRTEDIRTEDIRTEDIRTEDIRTEDIRTEGAQKVNKNIIEKVKKIGHCPVKSISDFANIETKKCKKTKPMETIISLSDNIDLNADYMRSKLIDFISKKDFRTIFGVKKAADIMKGLTENKWNKSLVIFVSFMFDTAFVYLNKDVVFNSDKSYHNKITI